MSSVVLKQGVTFQISAQFLDANGAPVLLAGYSAASQIVDPLGNVLAALTCVQPVGNPGFLNVYYAGSTGAWAVGSYTCDIVLTRPDGVIQATQSFGVVVQPGITMIGGAGGSGGAGAPAAGVGIVGVSLSQGAVTAGQPSIVTMTVSLSNNTTKTDTFTVPPGATGSTPNAASSATTTVASPTASQSGAATCTIETLPAKGSYVGQLFFVTDGNAEINAVFDPPPGIPVFWNGQTWVDAIGMQPFAGNLSPSVAKITAAKVSATYDLEVGPYANFYGTAMTMNDRSIVMLADTCTIGAAGNKLAAISAIQGLAPSQLYWAIDACAPGEVAGAGTGRWIYVNTKNALIDFATGKAATN